MRAAPHTPASPSGMRTDVSASTETKVAQLRVISCSFHFVWVLLNIFRSLSFFFFSPTGANRDVACRLVLLLALFNRAFLLPFKWNKEASFVSLKKKKNQDFNS